MICKQCGKEFTPNHGNQKYCSINCRTKAKNALDHQYYNTRKQEKTLEIIECEYCHKLFTPVHGNQKYCSTECQYHADLENNADSRMKSDHKNKKRGGDKFWGMGSGGLGPHMHEDQKLEHLKIQNELRRLHLVK